MKIAFTILLVLSVLGVAVFGVFGMNHESEHGMAQSNCLAAISKGIECTGDTKPLDAAAFHISAFKDFSLATLDADIANAAFFVFASLFVVAFAFFSPFIFQPIQFAFYKSRFRKTISLAQKQTASRWLSLHEHSPTAAWTPK